MHDRAGRPEENKAAPRAGTCGGGPGGRALTGLCGRGRGVGGSPAVVGAGTRARVLCAGPRAAARRMQLPPPRGPRTVRRRLRPRTHGGDRETRQARGAPSAAVPAAPRRGPGLGPPLCWHRPRLPRLLRPLRASPPPPLTPRPPRAPWIVPSQQRRRRGRAEPWLPPARRDAGSGRREVQAQPGGPGASPIGPQRPARRRSLPRRRPPSPSRSSRRPPSRHHLPPARGPDARLHPPRPGPWSAQGLQLTSGGAPPAGRRGSICRQIRAGRAAGALGHVLSGPRGGGGERPGGTGRPRPAGPSREGERAGAAGRGRIRGCGGPAAPLRRRGQDCVRGGGAEEGGRPPRPCTQALPRSHGKAGWRGVVPRFPHLPGHQAAIPLSPARGVVTPSCFA